MTALGLKEVLQGEYGFQVPEIKKLVGYANTNYLVVNNTNRFIFKTYQYTKLLWDILTAENTVLLHLAKTNTGDYPVPIPLLDSNYLKVVVIDGKKNIIRLLSFLEGTFVGDVTIAKTIAKSIGTFLGKMDIQLEKFDDYVLKARTWEWDLQHFHLNKKFLPFIENRRNRSLVHYFFQQYEIHVAPFLPVLRKQVIHNDANEWNLLLKGARVSGIIDFGDLTYAPLVNEVAIAMTYIAYDKDNPLVWACSVLQGYHDSVPLKEDEIALLYYLIAARLCTSVCNAAYAKRMHPENSYVAVSEENAWAMLYRWIKLNPVMVNQEFRSAVGFKNQKKGTTDDLLKRRQKHLSSILSVSYMKPIPMSGSAFQYMYDQEGNTFLDAYNNIPHVGHCHPKVVAAALKQMSVLNTNTRYLYDLLPEYAQKLLSKFPKSLNKVFFVNSGSAASDLAIRMAKAHTKKEKICVVEHGYHGNTQISIDISDYKFNSAKGQGQKDYVIKTKLPDTFRGAYTGSGAGAHYADDLKSLIAENTEQIAAFIAEPIVGCGGQVPLAPGYLKKVYPMIRKQGGICISDEVQTGFGRLGNHFWGFEMHGVIPDMVILGKPMGNGHPIGAVVTTDEIAASFEKGVEFFSSFGGNPVSCAVGLSVLEVIAEEGLQQNAKAVGDYYKDMLTALQKTHKTIGDVRGSGLFLGIDIVHAGTINTHHKLAQYLKNGLRQRHILISTDGPDDSVLKTKPPLCFTKTDAEQVVEALDKLLSEYTG